MDKLTRRQFQVWHFIYSYMAFNGNRVAPTQHEIGVAFSVTDRAAGYLVRTLVKKGYLETKYKHWRAVRIIRMPDKETWRKYA